MINLTNEFLQLNKDLLEREHKLRLSNERTKRYYLQIKSIEKSIETSRENEDTNTVKELEIQLSSLKKQFEDSKRELQRKERIVSSLRQQKPRLKYYLDTYLQKNDTRSLAEYKFYLDKYKNDLKYLA